MITGIKMENKNITPKIDEKARDTYRKCCKKKGHIISGQFEIMIGNKLKRGIKDERRHY
jgi:hypothetical protein